MLAASWFQPVSSPASSPRDMGSLSTMSGRPLCVTMSSSRASRKGLADPGHWKERKGHQPTRVSNVAAGFVFRTSRLCREFGNTHSSPSRTHRLQLGFNRSHFAFRARHWKQESVVVIMLMRRLVCSFSRSSSHVEPWLLAPVECIYSLLFDDEPALEGISWAISAARQGSQAATNTMTVQDKVSRAIREA